MEIIHHEAETIFDFLENIAFLAEEIERLRQHKYVHVPGKFFDQPVVELRK